MIVASYCHKTVIIRFQVPWNHAFIGQMVVIQFVKFCAKAVNEDIQFLFYSENVNMRVLLHLRSGVQLKGFFLTGRIL